MIQPKILDYKIHLVFQPIVRASDMQVAMYECLARFTNEQGELQNSYEVVQKIEDEGVILQLDLYILNQAIDLLKSHEDLSLSVNISAITIESFHIDLLNLLNQHITGFPSLANRLTLEITETAPIVNFHTTRKAMTNIRAMGINVALDDFGVGYNSFRYIRELPFNIVKIDKYFVTNYNKGTKVFIRQFIEVLKGLNIASVAEGIETPQQLNGMIESNATYLQGYLLGKPEIISFSNFS